MGSSALRCHFQPCCLSPPRSVFLSLPPSSFLSPHPALFEGELYSALWVVFNAFQMPEEILAWAQRSSDFGPLPHLPPSLTPKATRKKKTSPEHTGQ